MAKPKTKRFWQRCRIYFRRFRIGVWVLVLLLVGSLLYLNQVGLPGFVKKPILQKLRARGIDLQFSRLRLRWDQGLVAENVRFERAGDPGSPRLMLAQVKLSLQSRALARLKFQIDSLTLRKGQLVWPITGSNGPAKQLSIENIQTDLRLLPGDQWALDHFTALFGGAKIQVSGVVTNASAVRDWKWLGARQAGPPGALQTRLKQLADTLEQIRFSAPPELRLDLRGDGRDPQSFTIRLTLLAPDAETPWGTLTRGRFMARLLPAGSKEGLRADISLEAQTARTLMLSRIGSQEWTAITNLQLVAHLGTVEKQTNLVQGELSLGAGHIETQWGNATTTSFSAQWTHALTNPIPISGTGELHAESVETALAGGAGVSRLDVNARLVSTQPELELDPGTAWWTNLGPHQLEWDARLVGLRSPRLQADLIAAGGHWRAPDLIITNLHAELYQGYLEAEAGLNVTSRTVCARMHSNIDAHRLSSVLTEGANRWLGQYGWQTPPRVAAEISFVLPSWTNRHPNWRGEVQPTLNLAGEFVVRDGGAYRNIAVGSARSHFSYSNMTWRLPDLLVTRPEGRLMAFHQANDRTKEFYWKIDSSIDVRAFRPLLATNQQRDLDLVGFTTPPQLRGEVWGRWHDHESVGFKGQITVSNFTIRGESMTGLQTGAQFTNRFLLLTNAHGRRGTQELSADSLGIDFRAQKIFLSGGFSTAEPQVVARAIGPKVGKALEPYHFLRPPTARVHGIIPIREEADADLYFEVHGGPFQWSRFTLGQVNGDVHWKGERLMLENVRADCYAGTAIGSASFDFSAKTNADFQFNLAATNTLLQLLIADVSSHSNNLEGSLSGSLIINKANSGDWHSWQGGGEVNLRDGVIWDIPIFGIFSPVLNSVAPGLGNSRANAATGTFRISNGVVKSDDLEIRSPAMRLEYKGTVTFDGTIKSRVEAELLRDVWLLGPLVSTVFWPVTKLFEYELSGSLSQPKAEPVWFVPKLVLMPFHPLRTLKELLPEENSPPPAASKP